MTNFLEKQEEVEELIRLWKATLLTEEALQKSLTPVAPEIAKLEGRSYFKQPLIETDPKEFRDFLLGNLSRLKLPVSEEQLPFLHYLTHQDGLSRKFRQEIDHDFIIGFPAFYYRDKYGKEQLTTLFKFPLQTMTYPLAPDQTNPEAKELFLKSDKELELFQEPTDAEDTGLTYWLNEFFIQEELGISDEELLEYRKICRKNKLKTEECLVQFCKTILKREPEEEEEDLQKKEDSDILVYLLDSIHQFLGHLGSFSGNRLPLRVFPFALVYELDNIQPTRQLQLDLNDIISQELLGDVPKKHPAKSYLFGNNKEKRFSPYILGQYQPILLTESQDQAIRASKKRSLTTIKGPPGTGKTHIIRNLFADHLVRYAHQIGTPDEYVSDFRWVSLIASSNNRAVDNALGGMEEEDLLPVTLRVGSRIVLANATADFFQHYARQLSGRESYKNIKPFYQHQQTLRKQVKEIKSLSEAKSKDQEKLQELRYQAYLSARRTLDAWVCCNKEKLLEIIGGLIDDIHDRRGLRCLKKKSSLHLLLSAFPVIGCTLLSLRNFFPMEENSIGMVIIDEAGQCVPAYLLPAMLRSKKTVMIGDTMQLEPVAKMRMSDIEALRKKRSIDLNPEKGQFFSSNIETPRSSQHIAQKACSEVLELQDHFRCQQDIIRVSIDLCGYNMEVRTNQAKNGEHLGKSLQYVDVIGKESRYGSSWSNELEVEKIMILVQALRNRGVLFEDMAILTPYRGQLNYINYALRKSRIPHNSGEGNYEHEKSIATGTVHRFQGGERKIVLFSHVISNGTPLFLNSRVNLLNVAISRAQNQFIFVGSLEALSRGTYTAMLKNHLLAQGEQLRV